MWWLPVIGLLLMQATGTTIMIYRQLGESNFIHCGKYLVL